MKKNYVWLIMLVCAFLNTSTLIAGDQTVNDPTFGQLILVDEVDCGSYDKSHLFYEYPSKNSKIEDILGGKFRVMAGGNTGTTFFAYRIGKGKGLKPGACYLLEVDYPEDKPRSMLILNWGCETARGIHTGAALGDAMCGKYVGSNPESLKIPLTGKVEKFRQLFFMSNRFLDIKRPRGEAPRPIKLEAGFWVIIGQLHGENAPLSNGAAVSKIRLFELQDEKKAYVPLNLPPEGLPKRHVFWREEMSDSIIGKVDDAKMRGIDNQVDWYEYKVRLMKLLGIDTLCKDLLEFGHNQGWDSSKFGGSAWINQTKYPKLWNQIVTMAGKYNVNILPYYEYRGSIGQDKSKSLGIRNDPMRLDGGGTYTHVEFCENAKVDIVDKEALEDTRKILEITITDEKDKANFIGAWFRPRPSHNPISFNDNDLAIFSKEANNGEEITRNHLQDDDELLQKYYKWWFGKRRAYLEGIRDYLRKNVNPNAFVLYTTDASEPGPNISWKQAGKGSKEPWAFKNNVITDDLSTWNNVLSSEYAKKRMTKAVDIKRVGPEKMYLTALLNWPENWGEWDWKHASPKADPENYKDVDGVMLTQSFNRLYTVSDPAPFEMFRTKSGLAIVRHYFLNENEAFGKDGKKEPLGYFVADFERTGPYCMMAETVAMANGDPTLIGYLYGNSNAPGFPEYRRNFYQAFIALPALPSKKLNGAATGSVVVREIDAGKHGKYYSVSNTGMTDAKSVELKLPATGKLYDAATGQKLADSPAGFKIDMYPYELRALLVK